MLPEVIVFAVLAIILFSLRKYILFEKTVKWGFTFKKSGRAVSAAYKTFTGSEFYIFTFKKGAELTLSYEVTVEEGELTIEWNDGRNIIWSQTLKESGQGTFTAVAASRIHGINLVGKATKGNCRVEFSEKKN
ncbi:MAG: hypothetical protein ACQEUD_07210 [Bacillota bacterium]